MNAESVECSPQSRANAACQRAPAYVCVSVCTFAQVYVGRQLQFNRRWSHASEV